MSQQHRRELIENCFAKATTHGRAPDTQNECQGGLRFTKLGPPATRAAREFDHAASHLAATTQFNNQVGIVEAMFYEFDSALSWASNHEMEIESDPIQAMSDWIDSFPRARQAVDTYCAARAKEDLASLAQSARVGGLASPDDYMERRSRGRAM